MAGEFGMGDFLSAGVSSMVGSVLGTIVKSIRKPPPNLIRLVLTSFVSISVGTMVGGVGHEYFGFGVWVTSSIAACSAYLSDEIVKAIEANGQRVKGIKLHVPGDNE